MARVYKSIAYLWLIVCFSCSTKTDNQYLFSVLPGDVTGIEFSNDLPVDLDLNIFNYMYYYNGGGLGMADLNNDTLPDLIFSSNLYEEKVYLNEGNFKFKDVSKETGISGGNNSWTNGVSIADINGDGLKDIYLSQVGDYRSLNCTNKLFICTGIDENGIPHYSEQAAEYGLDFKGFSTHAGFFDFDIDGDLDLYLMNHSLHHNGTFGPRDKFLFEENEVSGDRLYRNDGDKFTNVTSESGIYNTVIGYGLGLSFGDVNWDGYPDIYVGNDFHENDYLYINQKDGTFKESINEWVEHTSRFSMGVDIADVNNDLYPDIISLDMLPEDPEILKRSEGEDALDIFNFKLGYGYNHQFAKNALQINTGNNHFTEIAMYAGVHATDWSWGPSFLDMNLDGNKDIFITNGIPKRMNDIDYIDFITGNDIQYKIQFDQLTEEDLKAIDKIPEIKLKNKFYLSAPEYKFQDAENLIENETPGYSNSAVYGDLDLDGDLDVVVNNINGKATVYENKFDPADKQWLKVNLTGYGNNKDAIGSKVIITTQSGKQIQELQQSRGFQSSAIGPLTFGTNGDEVKEVTVIWPDGTFTSDSNPLGNEVNYQYQEGLEKFIFEKDFKFKLESFEEVTGLVHEHQENDFVEFNREVLIPHSTSSDGPALAIGDLNHDGLEDVFVGSCKRDTAAIFYQNQDGMFTKAVPELFLNELMQEQVDAVIADFNQDGLNDLVTANGGNEFRLNSENSQPAIYISDSLANLNRIDDAFEDVRLTSSTIETIDINGDGALDLFIGARAIPWKYGELPSSYLLLNNGNGKFENVSNEYCPELEGFGFVKNSAVQDMDGDGDLDIILAMEWDGVRILVNEGTKFTSKTITKNKGWWNSVYPMDIDSDGDLDLICGNQGENSRLKISTGQPIRMYYNDMDDNGSYEQVLSYHVKGRELPFHNKRELEKQLPFIKKKFLYASDFAKADIPDIFPKEKLQNVFEADYFLSSVLINEGDMEFSCVPLPFQAQLSPVYAIQEVNANGDELPDILIAGNYFDANIQMGRYDANYGQLYLNNGDGNFEYVPLTGDILNDQVKSILPVLIKNNKYLVVARNNSTIKLINLTKHENRNP